MDTNKRKVAIGMRFFEAKEGNREAALTRLDNFLRTSETFEYPVFVAVNTDADTSEALVYMKRHHSWVNAFSVTPWGKFVPAMNALVCAVVSAGHEVLLSASAEFPPKGSYVNALLEHLDEDTLFVGARLPEHVFHEGVWEGTGASFPWNTFGVWNLSELAKFGFPLCGDAPFAPTFAGVEEFSTVALYQTLYAAGLTSFKAHAKLVTIPGFYKEWNTAGWDEERRIKHVAKIASKIARPAMQLKEVRLQPPLVIHIA